MPHRLQDLTAGLRQRRALLNVIQQMGQRGGAQERHADHAIFAALIMGMDRNNVGVPQLSKYLGLRQLFASELEYDMAVRQVDLLGQIDARKRATSQQLQ